MMPSIQKYEAIHPKVLILVCLKRSVTEVHVRIATIILSTRSIECFVNVLIDCEVSELCNKYKNSEYHFYLCEYVVASYSVITI